MVESCKIASNQKVNESRQKKMPDCTKAAYYTGKQSGCSAVV
ncbi:zinc metalloprotease [Neisseria gonorrhoeae]